MSTQALTIRIGADANGAISVILQTTNAVNNLGNAGNNANRSVASLSGGVQNLGRWSGQTTSAMASLTGGVSGLSRATLDAVNGTTRLNQQLAENTRITNAAAGSMRSLTSVLGAFGIAVGAVGLAQLTKSIVQNGMEIESLRAQLNMAMPSLAAAKESFNLIVKIAKETPQSISEISKAFIMMNNMGLNPTEKSMRGLTDMAAKLGGASDTLTGVIRGLGQAWMKGALHVQDTNQMIERGVPVYSLLVKVTGKTTAELMKMMEAGELTHPVMEKLHQELYKWGEGSSAKAMETLRGKIEALGSAWTAFSDVLMNGGAGKVLKTLVDGMSISLEYLTSKMTSTVDEQIAKQQAKIDYMRAHEKDFSFVSNDYRRLEFIKELGILDDLKKAKQKSIDDTAQYQKDKDTQAQGEKLAEELATNKAIANGDNDALKKFMSAKLSAIDEVNKKIIQTEADIAGIPPKLAMAIVSVESTGKVDALNKDSGAAGIMQVMPANYQKQGYTQSQMLTDASIGVRSGLKVYQNSLDEAKNAVKKGIIEVSQTIDYANALYTTKHKTIADRITKNGGVFDMELMPTATQDWSNKFNAALALQNTTVAESGKFAQRAAKEMKDFATEQEQAAKKIADNDRQLTESTAFGKYNATIDELTESFERGGISQATYSQGIENANETLLKNTDYAQENIKLLDQQAKEYAKLVGNVDDYNATISSLQDSLASKDISKEKFSVDVTAANAKLMNSVTGTNIPANAVAENQAAVANEKLANKIETVTKAYDNEWEALQKIRREIGLNSEAEHDANFKKQGYSEQQISNLKAEYEEIKKLKLLDDIGLSVRGIASSFSTMFSDVLTKGKSFTDALRDMFKNTMSKITDGLMNFGMTSMMSGNFLAGAASMAGSVVMGLLQSVFKGKITDLTDKETVLSGSVLGSANASNSIKNIVDTLNSIHAEEYVELKDINSNFKNLVEMTTKGTALALRDRGAFTPSKAGLDAYLNGKPNPSVNPAGSPGMIGAGLVAGSALGAATSGGLAGAALASATGMASATAVSGSIGMAAGGGIGAGAVAIGGAIIGLAGGLILTGLVMGLGKLLGIGKVKYEAVGSGIAMNAQQFMLNGMKKQVEIKDYSLIKQTVKGWLDNDVKYFDIVNGIDAKMSKLFTGLLRGAEAGLIKSVAAVGLLGEMNTGFMLPKMKLAMGSDPEKNQKKIEDWINKTGDDMAMFAVGATLSRFQQMGEGMMETVSRLASESVVAKSGFEKLGISVKLSGLGLVSFADSLANAFGGLKELQAGLQSLYDAFTSDEQKLKDAKTNVTEFISALKIPASAGLPGEIKSDADAKKYATYLGEAALKLQPALGVLKAVAIDKGTANPTRAMAQSQYLGGFLDDVGASILKNAGANVTSEIIEKALAVGGKYTLKEDNDKKTKTLNPETYKELIAYANLNSKQNAAFIDAKFNQELVGSLKELGIEMPKTISEMEALIPVVDELANSASSNVSAFAGLIKSTKMVTAENQKMIDSFKKAIPQFKESIEKWVLSKQITQLGTPETQFSIAQKDFEKTLGIIKNVNSTPEQITQAMNEITSSADAYISKIEQMYAHGDVGSNLIEGVVKSVASLPKQVDIQQQMVNLLGDIKGGVYKLPDDLASTLLGKSILSAQSNLTSIQSNTTLSDGVKNASVNTIATAITNAVQLGLSSFNQGIKDKGAAMLTDTVSATVEIATKLSIPNDKKQALIDGLGASLEGYYVIVNSKISDPAAELDGIINTYMAKASDSFASIFGTLSLEGTATGKFIYTAIAGQILAISNIEVPAFNVNGALTSISSITSAAQAALAAMQQLGAQPAASFVAPTPVVTATPEPAVTTTPVSNTNTTNNSNVTNIYNNAPTPVETRIKVADLATLSALKPHVNSVLSSLGQPLSAMGNSGGVAFYQDYLRKNASLKYYAKGGISDVPAIFGEAGTEAAVPLPDGRSIPVTLNRQAANDSSANTAELIAELKESNRQLQEQNRQLAALIALNQATLAENKKQSEAVETTATKTRMAAR